MLINSGFIQSLTQSNNLHTPVSITAIDRTDWFWTDVDLVSDGSTGNSFYPVIRTDFNGNIHAMWFDKTDYQECGLDDDIFYRFYDLRTKTWSSIEVVSTESSDFSQYPEFVMDSSGNIHTIWKDISNFDGCGVDEDIFYKRRDAETGLWSTTLVLSYFSTSISLGPSICIDSEDRVHAVWFDFTDYQGSGTDGDIFYTTLDPIIQQWSEIEVISTESTANSFYPNIDVDSEDNIHVGWGDYTDYLGTGSDADIFYKRWKKSLDYWTTTEVLSSHVLNIDPSTEVDLEIADDGTIYVTWSDSSGFYGVGTDDDICLNTWDPIAGTWSGAAIVSMYSNTASYEPSLCVDYSGVLHCVWIDATDYNGAGTDFDVFYRSYNPETSTWIDPIVITDNDDYSGIGNIISDEKGFLHIIFADSSPMENSDNDQDIFLTRLVITPDPPFLNEIIPVSSNNNSISLDWNDVPQAESYSIYKYEGDLQSSSDLSLYDSSMNNSFIDNIEKSGKYYYAIVASNEFGDSVFSNLVYVDLIIESTDSFFSSLAINEFIVLATLIIIVQVIFTTILYFLLKGKVTQKKKKKK